MTPRPAISRYATKGASVALAAHEDGQPFRPARMHLNVFGRGAFPNTVVELPIRDQSGEGTWHPS